MKPLFSRLSRCTLAGVLLSGAVLAAAPAAHGQDRCLVPGEEEYQSAPVCNQSPIVTLQPGSAGLAQPDVPVVVTAEDHRIDGDSSSFRIYLNNVDVTNAWGFTTEHTGWGTGRGWKFTSRANLTLSQATPSHTVKVQFCDAYVCDVREATYTLVLAGVEVTPDGGSVAVTAATTRTRAFTVTNRGTTAATFQLVPACREADSGGAVSPCSVPAPSLALAAGASATVSVTYPATQVDVPLTVSLTARLANAPGVQDAGWVDVSVGGGSGAAGAPRVALVDLNSTGQIDRRQCVTAAVGSGAAYECGDLRLAHALPSITTVGKTRAPVLLYNSQHAHPRPTIYADVTLAASSSGADSVRVTVTLADGSTRSKGFDGAGWLPGTTRRVAVQWDGLSMRTDVYPYQLQVTAWYAGTAQQSALHDGEVAVVNRSGSPFGAGWWLAGLEQLVSVLNGSKVMLVQGDGSTRVYTGSDAGFTWVSPSIERPDTLRAAWVDNQTQHYRRLPGGAQVWFDAAGRHYRTVDRLGRATQFSYDGQSRLQAVYPPAWTEALWWFTRDAAGTLLNVCAHVHGVGCRYTVLDLEASSGRVLGLQDPDGRWVRFGYGTGAGYRRVMSRTDRRGTVTSFRYDATGKLASAALPLAPGDSLIHRFAAAESRGVQAPAPWSQMFTLLDGPRTDVPDQTRVWVTRWGAPVRVRDALGGETRIHRTNALFPALATRVVAANGLVTRAEYGSTGRPDSIVVERPLGAGDAVTHYTWDNTWDAPATIRAPGAPTVSMGYDPANGNLLWRQEGSARVDVRYYDPAAGAAAGQVRAVEVRLNAAETAVDSVWYDGQGNPAGSRDALGFVTVQERDPLGRVTGTYTPVTAAYATTPQDVQASGTRVRRYYDAMGRDTLTLTYGPAITYQSRGNLGAMVTPAAELGVRTAYDAEGLPRRVARISIPDPAYVDTLVTEYEYDAAGRRIRETDGGQTQRFAYDHAGNLTQWTTGRGHVITTSYDALGRPLLRKVPRVQSDGSCFDACAVAFPYHPNQPGGALVIPEEWTHFRYDSAGSLVYAENADAIVRRSYYPNGLLRGDTLLLRSYGGLDFGPHVYGLEHEYDLLGRPVRLVHPRNLAPNSFADTWEYDPATGVLAAVTSRYGLRFAFGYDVAGRRTTVRGPGGSFADSLTYDRGGRQVRRQAWNSAGQMLIDESFVHDARGKLLTAAVVGNSATGTGGSDYHQWYTGLGSLAATDWDNHQNPEFAVEQFQTDALGNVYWRRSGAAGDWWTNPPYQTSYEAGRSRVANVQRLPGSSLAEPDYNDLTTRGYDASGNAESGLQEVYNVLEDGSKVTSRYSRTRSWYGADERLRYYQEHLLVTNGSTVEKLGVWEEYRYDPLGRRVLVRSNGDGLCDQHTKCTSHITRTVWSGDQVLWELRAPGGGGAQLESDAGSGPLHGRVSYFHAGGIDRPLVIEKNDTSIIPHQNWRGQFAFGTFANGQISNCTDGQTTPCANVPWPGQRTTAWHFEAKAPDVRTWYGGLVDGMRDGSGRMYMRNRYYDPATGQFTQTDPIGLAGGLNSYGFAAGDPVTYSDPYGLDTLSTRERRRLGNFCDRVDCDQVQVHRGRDTPAMNALRTAILKSSGGRAVTLGNHIFLGDRRTQRDFGTLAHEMTHVFQYQSGQRAFGGFLAPTVYLSKGGAERIRELAGGNPYDVSDPWKPWNELGMEQQGALVQDCFTGNREACVRSIFTPR